MRKKKAVNFQVALNLRIDQATYEQLKIMAKEQNKTLSELIRDIFKEYTARPTEQQPVEP